MAIQGADIPYYDPATGQMSGGLMGNIPGQAQLQTVPPQQSPFAGAMGSTTGDQINADYRKYLGRDPGHFANGAVDPGEAGSFVWDAWSHMDPAAAEAGIRNSPEAQAFAKTGQGANTQGTPAAASGQPPAVKVSPTGLDDPNASAFFKMLQGRIGQSLAVDPNDPVIAKQSEAFNAQNTRAGRDVLTAAAERGGPTANLTAANMSVAENSAQQQSGFLANLMGQERQARRGDIQQALSLGASFLSDEQKQKLQAELDQMNLQERSYEFDTNQAYLESPFAPGAGA